MDWIGLDWLDSIGLEWIGWAWVGLERIGLDWIGDERRHGRRLRSGGKHGQALEKRYELLSGVSVIAAVPFVTMFDRLTGRIVSGLAFELQCVVADQRHVWGCAKCPHTLSMSLFEPVSYHQ